MVHKGRLATQRRVDLFSPRLVCWHSLPAHVHVNVSHVPQVLLFPGSYRYALAYTVWKYRPKKSVNGSKCLDYEQKRS